MNLAFAFFRIFCCLWALGATGCRVAMINLTPENTPTNPSSRYGFSMQVKGIHSKVNDQEIQSYLVIDGKRHPMKPTTTPRVFSVDYKVPSGQQQAAYYFDVDYTTKKSGERYDRHFKSMLYRLNLIDKYVTLETQRALVGSQIGLVGRGFTPEDRILVGGRQAETQYASTNALSIIVPNLPVNERYPVELLSEGESILVGTLQIDSACLTVESDHFGPDGTLHLESGQEAELYLEIQAPAPKGGLAIDITTDIPDSVIMPKVKIKEGQTQASIPITGDAPGQGELFFSAEGYSEVSVPVSVGSKV